MSRILAEISELIAVLYRCEVVGLVSARRFQRAHT
jgi:hypothetical protein